MKAAAAQVGFGPAFVERAARLLAAKVAASPFERLIGGPLRHEHKVRLPIVLDEKRAAQLLSAIRISAGESGGNTGHSGPMGMTWRDGGEMDTLSVTARPEEDGTSVAVAMDRRGTLVTVAAFSGMAMFFALLFAGNALHPAAAWLGFGGVIVGVGGVLAVARGYWTSSTKKVQERISVVMGAIGQTLTQPQTHASGHDDPPFPCALSASHTRPQHCGTTLGTAAAVARTRMTATRTLGMRSRVTDYAVTHSVVLDGSQILQRAVAFLSIFRANERPFAVVFAEECHLGVMWSLTDDGLIGTRSLADVQV